MPPPIVAMACLLVAATVACAGAVRAVESSVPPATAGDPATTQPQRCELVHYAVAELLLEGDDRELLRLLDAAGPLAAQDRFLAEARVEALFRARNYHQAALALKRALPLPYTCEFTRAYRAVPFQRADLLVDGLSQHSLAAIHRALGETAAAEAAQARSRRLLRASIVAASGTPAAGFEAEVRRLLSLYGIDRARPRR